MRKELDERLCNEFPNLYADRNASPMESRFSFGFEFSDGWFDLIYEMSSKLEALIVAMPEGERGNYKAAQMKEKFGTLRAYMTSETEEMRPIISEAERRSEITCEFCGAPGKLRNPRSWLITLCDDCHQKREAKRSLGDWST